MKPSNELFLLIKSLSKAEMRYFTLNTAKQKANRNYIKLFNEIFGQKHYDETALKEKFKGEPFIKQLTFTKNYLYNLVLKSLAAYNFERSPEARLMEHITRLKILYKKTLFEQYFRQIKIAKIFAARHEKFSLMIELLRMERLMVKASELKKRNIKGFYEEEEKLMEKLRNISAYSEIFSGLVQYPRIKGKVRSRADLQKLKEIVNRDILKDTSKALSVQALEYFYNIWKQYYSITGEYGKEYEMEKKRLSCIDANPHIFADSILDERKSVLNSLMQLSIKQRNFTEFHQYLHKYKSILPVDKNDKMEMQLNTEHAMLLLSMAERNYTAGIERAAQFEASITKFENKMDRDAEFTYYFFLAGFYLSAGKYESSLKYINKILNHTLRGYRKDIESYAKILNIILHYEMGNYELAEYLITSTEKFLNKRDELYPLESAIIKYLKMLIKEHERKNIIGILKKFKTVLETPIINNAENPILEYFDLAGWIAVKIKQAS